MLKAFTTWLKLNPELTGLPDAALARHPLILLSLAGLRNADLFDEAVDATAELIYSSGLMMHHAQPPSRYMPLVQELVRTVRWLSSLIYKAQLERISSAELLQQPTVVGFHCRCCSSAPAWRMSRLSCRRRVQTRGLMWQTMRTQHGAWRDCSSKLARHTLTCSHQVWINQLGSMLRHPPLLLFCLQQLT